MQLAGDYGLTLTKPQQWGMCWSDKKILNTRGNFKTPGITEFIAAKDKKEG
jgi:hypothetical protein